MLSQFTHTFIEINVSDRCPGVKQKARRVSMLTHQHPTTGEFSVLAKILVTPYVADVNGPDGYGAPLVGYGILPYEVTLVADNNTAVNPTTGAVVLMRTTQTSQQWVDEVTLDSRQLMLQGDFFELLSAYSPIAIDDLMEDFMRQADGPPFNKYCPS